MTETIQLGDVSVEITRKGIKHAHLSVHPPLGRVTLVTPQDTRPEVARAFVISKLGWIRDQQAKLQSQAREPVRQFVTRETNYLWGRRHLLSVVYSAARPGVSVDHRQMVLTVRPGSTRDQCDAVMHAWHKALLHEAIPPIIRKWEPKLDVKVSGYFLQRMKTKWGSCNHERGHIRLNTELVKKPKDLLEYVIVHEMAHLIAPTHNEHFIALLDKHFPAWREARLELNALPLSETG
ncbi:MAG: M48 family peptidase [Oxalobacteraceae bacterium]|nr:MAG: M48 family peptidase [Oxalobacteraceae bacterium]